MTYTKYIVVAVLAVAAFAGGYFFPKSTVAGTASSAGATYGDAKFAGVSINLANAGSNGTSTTIVNTDAVDRYILSIRIGCQGFATRITNNNGGVANLNVSIGTTTSATPAAFLSNSAVAQNLIVPTTSLSMVLSVGATTTPSTFGISSTTNSFLWSAGTGLTFFWNATSSNTTCSEGVDYIGA